MKKTTKTMFALMAGTLALAACSGDATPENDMPQLTPGTKYLTITAQLEEAGTSRTGISARDANRIVWGEGDQITVLYRNANTFFGFDNATFTLSKTDASATLGTFGGNVLETVTDATLYTALYPCQPKDEYSYTMT